MDGASQSPGYFKAVILARGWSLPMWYPLYPCLSAVYSSQVMTAVWVGEANSIMAVAMSSYSCVEPEQASVR